MPDGESEVLQLGSVKEILRTLVEDDEEDVTGHKKSKKIHPLLIELIDKGHIED